MDESQKIYPPNVVNSTSSGLLELARGKDASAWRQLLQVYGPVIRYWIRRSGLTSADVADVFQNVFYAVSTNLERFEPQEGKGSFRKWLKVITNSKIADHYRKIPQQANAVGGSAEPLTIEVAPAEVVEESAVDQAADEKVVMQQVTRLIQNEFSQRNWQAFWRTVVDGLTSTEVADELGTTPTAVRKAKSRVLARLREAIQEYDV